MNSINFFIVKLNEQHKQLIIILNFILTPFIEIKIFEKWFFALKFLRRLLSNMGTFSLFFENNLKQSKIIQAKKL